MKQCRACKKEIDDKATKCPHCQTKQGNWVQRHPIWSVIIGLMIFGMFNSATSGNKTNSTNDSSNSQQQASSPTPTPTPDPNPHFDDGSWEVGKDIQPGTYRTRKASSSCYYSRLSGFGGSLDEILANENTSAPAVVTILAGDKGFKSSRCGTWTQDLSQITESKTSFGDGIFIVGTDIEPGTYKNEASSGCYYSRLRGFTGTLSDIVSNENTDDVARVTILASDKGFKSNRCGTWTKQ